MNNYTRVCLRLYFCDKDDQLMKLSQGMHYQEMYFSENIISDMMDNDNFTEKIKYQNNEDQHALY